VERGPRCGTHCARPRPRSSRDAVPLAPQSGGAMCPEACDGACRPASNSDPRHMGCAYLSLETAASKVIRVKDRVTTKAGSISLCRCRHNTSRLGSPLRRVVCQSAPRARAFVDLTITRGTHIPALRENASPSRHANGILFCGISPRSRISRACCRRCRDASGRSRVPSPRHYSGC
jgi:hypothetical protein